MQIKGVIFDMDGLLLDTERVYLEGFRVALDQHGLPQDDDIFRRMMGTNRDLGRAILTEGLAGRVTLTAFDEVWDAHIATRLRDGIPVKPSVPEMASHLKASGLPYIIATSTRTDKAHDHLDRAGIGHHFPDVIGGDQVQRSKPAPDIYLHAARTLGLPAENCAAFEDSPNGLRAAHAAGCIAVHVPDLVPADDALQALAHHTAQDLRSAFAALGLVGAVD